MSVGKQFETGNSTIASLAPGSTLKVVGPGKVLVTSVPEVVLNEGDKIYVASKSRIGRVVRFTSRLANPINSTQVLYVADGTNVVRVAAKSDVKKLS